MKKFDPAKAVFLVSGAFLLFALGFAVRHYQFFPYSVIRSGVDALRQVFAERETLAGTRPTDLTRPARHEGTGVTQHVEGAPSEGLTFVASFFDGNNELRLLRLDGSVIHRWPVRLFDAFENLDHLDPEIRPKSEWNTYADGAIVLPDGSVVFHFGYVGMAKLDRCGNVAWTLPQMTHHTVSPSEDGGFWIGSGAWVRENSPFPLLDPAYFNETIVKVSAEGKVVYEKPVLELFFNNSLAALLFANGSDGIAVDSEDLVHLNDIEELTPAMAPAFPAFAAGDLLLSLRSTNLLMVIDPETGKVKWSQVGPWLAQHDPDFQPDGTISVYSNNNDGTPDGSRLGGSQILEVTPGTGEVRTRYGGQAGEEWYSAAKGRHQYLPNGNVLIVSSEAGRMIEVNEQREIVWEYINRYDADSVSIVWAASRHPEDYFTVKDWTCPSN